ncbi:MAG TPA: hypothetical protein VFX96_20170 [Pyrinomonadaceae bacterium]|nr:hypothetical protein [Pyrinomonadaceae bacterium]
MSNTTCPRCGLVYRSSAEVCERCGAPPDGGVPEERAPESARPDFPVLTLGHDMSTGSSAWKPVLAIILVVALGGAGLAVYKWRTGTGARSGMLAALDKKSAPPSLDERTRDTLLTYLAQPGFAGERVAEQVLGPVRLELLQLPDREVYFSAPAPDQTGEPFEAMLARFVADPKRVVLAQDDGAGRLRLGKYSVGQSADKHFFFKMPVDNVKFDPATVLKFHFGQATYTLDMRELSDFLENKSIFGGRMTARTGQSRAGLPVVFANHGAFVARPKETSLGRLVDELTRDIPAESSGAREARVQRVLDFVSREIIYDLREATYSFELLKRPNEVLMTGESDCSNKAILLGSLLEQLGEDYLFVYTPDHITVAVRQGDFPARNGLFLGWDREVWLIAEGTVPGFRIGVDRVQDEARLKRFQHVQRPRDRDMIFDLATGRQLLFQ